MSNHTYKTTGTCSVEISFDLDGDIVRNIQFQRGCAGNTKGVSSLADGMNADELVEKLEGIHCGDKQTSCPDQLAKAVKCALSESKGA